MAGPRSMAVAGLVRSAAGHGGFRPLPLMSEDGHVIERYTLPEMGRIWSEANKYELWCRVETLVLEAHARAGTVPADSTRNSSGRTTLTTASASRQRGSAGPSRPGLSLIRSAPQIRSADTARPGRR